MGPPQHAWSTEFVGQNFYKYCGTPVSRTLLCSTMSTARCPHLRGYACFCLRGTYLLVVCRTYSGPHLSECMLINASTHSEQWMDTATTQEQSWQPEADTHIIGVNTHTAQWSSNGCIHGQLKALSDVLSWPFIQVAVTLLRFLLLPVSYNTPSGKASLKSLGLSLSLLIGIGGQTESTLAVYAVMQ